MATNNIGTITQITGAVVDVRFDADPQDARQQSIAWLPGADWSRLTWLPIDAAQAAARRRFVAPYPASLLKLMLALAEVAPAVEWYDDPRVFDGFPVERIRYLRQISDTAAQV